MRRPEPSQEWTTAPAPIPLDRAAEVLTAYARQKYTELGRGYIIMVNVPQHPQYRYVTVRQWQQNPIPLQPDEVAMMQQCLDTYKPDLEFILIAFEHDGVSVTGHGACHLLFFEQQVTPSA